MNARIALAATLALAGCTAAQSSLTPSSPVSRIPAAARAWLAYRIGLRATACRCERQAPRVAPDTLGLLYPADLTDSGGPIMKTADAYNLYAVNCAAGNESCWGDPGSGFQKRLGFGSSLCEAFDPVYEGLKRTAYTFAGSASVRYKTFTDVSSSTTTCSKILHDAIAAGKLPTGASRTSYHIFLPKGAWTCFDGTSCYSPGQNGTSRFFAPITRTSDFRISGWRWCPVEPWRQNVSGCASKASAGANALTNSTASTLGHETFESITDPGQKYAWFNFTLAIRN